MSTTVKFGGAVFGILAGRAIINHVNGYRVKRQELFELFESFESIENKKNAVCCICDKEMKETIKKNMVLSAR